MIELPQSKGDAVMRSKLKELITRREVELGRRIKQLEIAEATSINPNTISRWMEPTPFKRIEAEVVVPLCKYLQCGLDDIIELEYVNPE